MWAAVSDCRATECDRPPSRRTKSADVTTRLECRRVPAKQKEELLFILLLSKVLYQMQRINKKITPESNQHRQNRQQNNWNRARQPDYSFWPIVACAISGTKQTRENGLELNRQVHGAVHNGDIIMWWTNKSYFVIDDQCFYLNDMISTLSIAASVAGNEQNWDASKRTIGWPMMETRT